MADRSDDMMSTRIDASSRLTSLRTATGDAAAAASTSRRPKFVPKAAKRRTAAEDGQTGEQGDNAGQRPAFNPSSRPQRAGDLTRDRPRVGGRGAGSLDGRGRGRGRGANLPTGRVAFVGSLSAGSSYSSGGTLAPRSAMASKPTAAADGVGISVLDDDNGVALHDDFGAMEIEEQWPPVVKSVMEPMTLPFARRPEPPTTGAIFCDANGQFHLPNDSLLFLQLPTTLPLANATRVSTAPKQEAEPEPKQPVNKFAVKQDEPMELAKKEEEATAEEAPELRSTEQVFDRSIATAPGGFVGKLCVHASGKVVLMLGDKKFDVATGHTPAFGEELLSIDAAEHQLCMLGPIDRHLIVTPDFDALLA